ncbi:extracellular solute-binding protein [Paenibacillus sp. NRS-1760]|uniref:extracellular solute-binding protein n=1 Tax=Paenibacillus sp. NRS-1760 TaxID=3233902 RepID=UPI003D284E4F
MVTIQKSRLFRMNYVVGIMLVVFSVIAAGCSNNANVEGNKTNASTEPASTATSQEEDPFKEHMEISVGIWGITDDAVNVEKDALVAEISKKLNITLVAKPLTFDDYTQKISLWVASGQLPDIFAIDAVGSINRSKWINEGIVRSLPDDLSKYPNLDEVMKIEDIDALKVNDKQYNVPRLTWSTLQHNAKDRFIIYRWDWAQSLGITKEPETYDEFAAMIKAMVEKDPEGKKTTGLTTRQKTFLGDLWLPYNPAVISDGSGTDFKWIKENDKFIPALFSTKTLDGLKAIKGMFEQNIIDKDVALLKTGEGDDKFYSGRAAALITNGIAATNFNKVYPDKKAEESIKILKLWPDADGVRYQPTFKTYWSESYFSAKVDDKKMERIMALYDYLLSPEGKDLYRYGIEDVDYTKKDGQIVLNEGVDLNKKYPSIASLKMLASFDGDFELDPNTPPNRNNPTQQLLIDYVNWSKQSTKIPEFDFRLSYMSTPTKDKFSITDVDDLIQVVLSKEPVEDAWNEIVKKYENKGLSKMIEEVNAKAAEQGIK